MFKWFKRFIIATYWYDRAAELQMEGHKKAKSWDCDVRCEILMKEMIKDGLRLGRDFVLVRCKLDDVNHVFIELYGKNPRDNVKLNGYIIDPTPVKLKLLSNFHKGTYSPEGVDYYGTM